jgi:deoxyribose-phosphate aldolase
MKLNADDFTYRQVVKTLDHSILKPEMTEFDVIANCEMARHYDIAAVSVKPCYLPLVVEQLAGTDIAPGTVVSFPHGHSTTAVKVFEAQDGVANGATELDIVMNIGALRSGQAEQVRDEIRMIVEAVAGKALVKVILENHYLTEDQKVLACHVLEEAGVDYVKTSSGYAESGATVTDLNLMRANVSAKVLVKAAGGIRKLDDALAMIKAGASRVGTSSTKTILAEFLEQNNQVREGDKYGTL